MPFDAITINCLCNELSGSILDCKIEKIYQPEKDEIHLILKRQGFSGRLLISADSSNPRIHLTNSSKTNPVSAPMFCMLMRKHLTGGKIKSVSQYGFERVIDIEVSAYNELADIVTKHIIVEIMGKHSNIIFTDCDMRIIDSIKHIDITVSSLRNILPGLTYSYPPPQQKANPLNLTKDDFADILLKRLSLGEISINRAVLTDFLGFSPLASQEISHLATGDADAPLLSTNIQKTAQVLETFLNKIKNASFSPCVIYSTEKPLDFSAFELSLYSSLVRSETFASISEALDSFYVSRDRLERMRQRSHNLRKTVSNHLDRLIRKLKIQEETIRDAENKEKYRVYGELITSNMYRLSYGDSVLVAENYYDENAQTISIPLDSSKSPSQNAQNYFKRYRKIKKAEEMALEQRISTKAEIAYMESVLMAIDNAEDVSELDQIRDELYDGGYIKRQKNSKKSKADKAISALPRKYIVDGIYELYVGKNNRQNDYLTMKIARSHDLWFHIKNSPGAHVVLKKAAEPPTNDVIEKAARIAAYFSSVNTGAKVEVDYTEIKNVKKPSGSKPGMVIYDNYSTAVVSPLSPENL